MAMIRIQERYDIFSARFFSVCKSLERSTTLKKNSYVFCSYIAFEKIHNRAKSINRWNQYDCDLSLGCSFTRSVFSAIIKLFYTVWICVKLHLNHNNNFWFNRYIFKTVYKLGIFVLSKSKNRMIGVIWRILGFK